MTNKLANSLRKSVSEEQKSVTKPSTTRTRTTKSTAAVTEQKISQNTTEKIDATKIDNHQKTEQKIEKSKPQDNSESSKLLQLTNLTTEKFRIINQDIMSYLQEISGVKSVYNLSNLNVELIKKLTEHQQELFNESINILNKKK
ncbi:MAG: hypothetical protein PHC75_05525 [Burkholderiales bacterium]|nr:hypothetical protein [Burkholderiales bacterium]